MEVISPGGADGRDMATGVFFANGRLAVVGRQIGKMFIYDVTAGKLLASSHNGLTGPENTFLNDVTFAPDGSANVTDSVNPVLYRMVPSGADTYRLEEYVHWDVQKVGWVRAPGAAGINFNGVVVTPDGKYLILSKRNDSGLYRFEIATKEITKVQLPMEPCLRRIASLSTSAPSMLPRIRRSQFQYSISRPTMRVRSSAARSRIQISVSRH